MPNGLIQTLEVLPTISLSRILSFWHPSLGTFNLTHLLYHLVSATPFTFLGRSFGGPPSLRMRGLLSQLLLWVFQCLNLPLSLKVHPTFHLLLLKKTLEDPPPNPVKTAGFCCNMVFSLSTDHWRIVFLFFPHSSPAYAGAPGSLASCAIFGSHPYWT